MRRPDRALLLAFAVSVLLHVAAIVWLAQPAPELPVPSAVVPVELTWVEVENPPAVEPQRREPARPSPVAQSARQKKVASELKLTPLPGPLPTGERGPPDQAPAGHEPPRLATLEPRLDLLAPVGSPEVPRGRTLHPEDMPSEAELNAEAEARVADRIEQFARDRIAEARVEGGLVDPYFTDLRQRIRAGLETVPDFSTDTNPVRKLSRAWYGSWRQAAASYGATGTPYEAPVGRGDTPEVSAALQREADRGSPQARELAQTLQMGARLRDFGDGRMGAELYAIVELHQSGAGLIEQVLLLQPSGVPQFDAWVLDRAATAVDELGPLDAGSFPTGMRSTWAFSGRVSYRRSMKDVKLVDDGWYLALAAVPGLLTGTFDEVSGKVEYIDLRHPHYEARVKLLRVYDGAR